jgi:hypothetical protein
MPWPELPLTTGTYLGGRARPTVVSWHGQLLGIGNLPRETEEMAGEVVVARSTDWIQWTTLARGADLPFDHEQAVGFVATGSSLVLLTSPYEESQVHVWTSVDAVHWVRQDDSPFKGGSILDTAVGPAGVVAVGYVSGAGPDAAVWFTKTGSDWRKTSLPGDTSKDDRAFAVTATGAGFVAVGWTGFVDGYPIEGREPRPWEGDAAAWYSADGLVWQRAGVEGNGKDAALMEDVVSSDHGLVATGYLHIGTEPPPAAWTSDDGIHWRVAVDYPNPRPESFKPAVPISWVSAFFSDGHRMVAQDERGEEGPAFQESPDGVTWRKLSNSGPGMEKLPWLEPQAVVVLPDGLVVFDSGAYRPQVFRAVAVP